MCNNPSMQQHQPSMKTENRNVFHPTNEKCRKKRIDKHAPNNLSSPMHSFAQPRPQKCKVPQPNFCYINPAVLGVPNASERGTKLDVARKWADSLYHPCRLGGCQPFGARENQKRFCSKCKSSNCKRHLRFRILSI